jgi:hypothetical protein
MDEYPKWVAANLTRVEYANGGPMLHYFSFHIDRSGVLWALVQNADEEHLITSDATEQHQEEISDVSSLG